MRQFIYLFLEARTLPVHRASSFHVGRGTAPVGYRERDPRAATVRREPPYFETYVVAAVAGAAAAAFVVVEAVVVVVAAAAVASAASRFGPNFPPR